MTAFSIDASSRLRGVEQLIDMKQYFVIHAARQSCKTTYLKDLTRRLNEGGKYYALCCSLEAIQVVENEEKGIPAIVRNIRNMLRFSDIPQKEKFAKNAEYEDFTSVLNTEFSLFCMKLDKPLVVLFDEVDCLSEGKLISFMRQLRKGYNDRCSIPFIHPVALVGMRNINYQQDYNNS